MQKTNYVVFIKKIKQYLMHIFIMDNLLNDIEIIDDINIANSKKCDINEYAKQKLPILDSEFTIISQNIRSIYKNFEDLNITLAQLKTSTDLIVLTECRLDCNKPIPQITNYTSFHTTNHVNQCNGVVVYIKKIL